MRYKNYLFVCKHLFSVDSDTVGYFFKIICMMSEENENFNLGFLDDGSDTENDVNDNGDDNNNHEDDDVFIFEDDNANDAYEEMASDDENENALEVYQGNNLDDFVDDNPFNALWNDSEDDRHTFFLPLPRISEDENVPLRPPSTIKERIMNFVKEILVESRNLKVPSTKLEKMCSDSWTKYLTNIEENLDLRKSSPPAPFFPDPFVSSESLDRSDKDNTTSSEASNSANQNPKQDCSSLEENIQSIVEKNLSSRGSPFPTLSHSLDSGTEEILKANLEHFKLIRSHFQELDELIQSKAESDCLTLEEQAEIRRLRNTLEELYNLNISVKKCMSFTQS